MSATRRSAAMWATVVCAVLVIGSTTLGTCAAGARAARIAPGWAVSSLPQPSNFSNAENALCENSSNLCDAYVVTVTNMGAAPSDGTPIVITDRLPQGVVIEGVEAKEMESGQGLACVTPPAGPKCTYEGILRPGDALYVKVRVTIATNATLLAVANSVDVEGGGAAAASVAPPMTVTNSVNSEGPEFGPQLFSLRAYGPDGASDVQAGDHPNMLVTTLDYNTVNFALTHPGSGTAEVSVREPKTIILNFPVGLLGNPLSAPTCPEADLRESGPGCPANSQVGTVIVDEHGVLSDSDEREGLATSIYNMTPQHGSPMEFAFNVANEGEIAMYPRFIPTASGLALSIAVPAQPRSGLTPVGTTLMFFGDPALRDAELHQRVVERETGHSVPLEKITPAAMFTNPTDCGARPTTATVEMNSWVQPHQWATRTSPVYDADPLRQVTGCSGLQFNPQIEVTPEETLTDTPSGYTVDIKVPQAPNFMPVLATPALKNAELHLPAGVAISPAAGTGLVACDASGPEGINITHGWTPTGVQPLDPADPEAMELGEDGLPRIAPGHCPSASRVGAVEITTPLLAEPLKGRVYIAEPKCGLEGQAGCTGRDAGEGDIFGLYAEASGENSGVIIKLEGKILVDPLTGNMTVKFEETPQLPFSDLKLTLKGGERALLSNPQGCAVAETTSELTPWGATEANVANPSSSFQPTGCPASEPFSPGFLAQMSTPAAGGSSPLTVTVTRHDGEQGLLRFALKAPPGVLGLLSAVPPCAEAQAAAGTCPAESQIGHMLVAAGSGPQPVWESGAVYLTAGYGGAPFGLSITTPADVGPFHLGNVITRAAIHIDPHTAALTIDATLPQIVDGVPLRMQAIDLTIDRPGFMVNPTNCAPQRMTATVTGALSGGGVGAIAAVSTPFAAAGCRSLPFAPKLTVLTHAKTSKASGAYLLVNLTAKSGADNIAKVKVVLPKQLPSRLTTLQKACVPALFDANPASCPSGSIVGTGTVATPLLKNPLSGPAYLVSRGSEYPDLEIVLQGEGVTITLDGSTHITNGSTSSAFKELPDTPLTSFSLVLPQGPNALLGANANLCTAKLAMPTALIAQNGATIKRATKIAVSGCPKRHGRAVSPRSRRRA
jgi:hypothetical protein